MKKKLLIILILLLPLRGAGSSSIEKKSVVIFGDSMVTGDIFTGYFPNTKIYGICGEKCLDTMYRFYMYLMKEKKDNTLFVLWTGHNDMLIPNNLRFYSAQVETWPYNNHLLVLSMVIPPKHFEGFKHITNANGRLKKTRNNKIHYLDISDETGYNHRIEDRFHLNNQGQRNAARAVSEYIKGHFPDYNNF